MAHEDPGDSAVRMGDESCVYATVDVILKWIREGKPTETCWEDGAKTKYIIALTEGERDALNRIISEQKESKRTVMRAKILLMSDVNTTEKMSIPKLAEQLGTTHTTVQTVRTEYGKYGLEAAVYRKHRTDNRKVTSEVEEGIRRLLSDEPPEGHKRWTERLLCRECMNRGIIEHIALSTMHETMQRINGDENK